MTSMLAQDIKELKDLVEQGLLEKSELPALIKDLIKNSKATTKVVDLSTEKASPTSRPLEKDRMFHDKAEKALKSTKKHRGRASPETLMIRRIIELAMIKRFRLQCALPDSPLFGRVAPRRLNEPLFNRACHSPLRSILQKNAEELSNIPAGKVVKNCKWKIRKMRGNLLGKDVSNYAYAGKLCNDVSPPSPPNITITTHH